jgi:hypothetical protein
MLDARDAQRRAKPSLGGRPDVDVTAAELVCKKAEALGGVLADPDRQWQPLPD